jgi:hypothetical protein
VVADAMDKIKEKKEKLKEGLDKFDDNSKEIQELSKSCVSDKSDNVGNGACGPDSCNKELLAKCSGTSDETQLNAILDLVENPPSATKDETKNKATETKFSDALSKLRGFDCSSDPQVKEECKFCVTSKKEQFNKDVVQINSGEAK